jgi:tRNA pseudouridine13 synthase
VPAGAADAALAAALAPPHALGPPVAAAQLRAAAADFVVEEELGFLPAGSGAHVLLKVRKVDANTAWVARQLARAGGCRPAEVGYAGLKDRRAVAVQWFSVPRPRTPPDWLSVRGEGFEVLAAHAHARKLPRGALAGNRFAVRLRALDGDGARLSAALAPRIAAITQRGVPNYFGPQRFGREGANLHAAQRELRDLDPATRGFVLSAARSLIFNALLAERVTRGSWEHLEAGDLAALDGRGSFFEVRALDETLAARAARLEIHPTGPLWGRGAPATHAQVLELEQRIAAHYAAAAALCTGAGMDQERRSLRLRVVGLECQAEADAALLRFTLTRGSFATAVLRELIAAPAAAEEPE